MNEIEQLLHSGIRLTWRPNQDEFDATLSYDQQFHMYLVYAPHGAGETEHDSFATAWEAFQTAISQGSQP